MKTKISNEEIAKKLFYHPDEIESNDALALIWILKTILNSRNYINCQIEDLTTGIEPCLSEVEKLIGRKIIKNRKVK